MLSELERDRLCATARSYIGVPSHPHGRSHLGVDCIGVVVMSLRGAGLEVDEGPVDYRGLDSKRIVAMLLKYCDRLPADAAPIVGDIVVYGIPREGHVGLLVDGDPLNMIHCPWGRQVVEARFDPGRGKVRGVYRWRR